MRSGICGRKCERDFDHLAPVRGRGCIQMHFRNRLRAERQEGRFIWIQRKRDVFSLAERLTRSNIVRVHFKRQGDAQLPLLREPLVRLERRGSKLVDPQLRVGQQADDGHRAVLKMCVSTPTGGFPNR